MIWSLVTFFFWLFPCLFNKDNVQKGPVILVVSLLMLPLAEAVCVAAPQPSVDIAMPDGPFFLGGDATIEFTFDNNSSSDTGYGPFIDVILPVNGADGASGSAEPDGIDIRGDATYLGAPVTTVVLSFPDDGGGRGCVDHPYAVNATTKDPLRVCGQAGDKLVVMQLPFGSFVPEQPPAVISLPVSISPKADLNHALDVKARAGFQFGADPLDNPKMDPPVLSDDSVDSDTWSTSSAVDPVLIRLEKTYEKSDNETATGPNFPKRYRINVRLAPGQTVTNLDVIDNLPSNMAFKAITDINPSSYTVVHLPPSGVASSPPDNQLDVQFSSVTGDNDTESVDAYVVFEYFIPLQDANGNNVIDPQSGDDALSPNEAKAIGDWDPVDDRDPAGQDNAIADAPGPEHTLKDKAIAIQKGHTIATDNGASGYSPGDIVEYTLSFQVSDYFSFDDVNVTDIISDGQDFDTSFTPVLTINMNGSSSSQAIDSSNFSRVANANGTETVVFHVSSELNRRLGDSKMVGGCIPDNGTGPGNQPDCSVHNDGATTATIVFRAVIKEDFDADYPSGDESVDQGDLLSNRVNIEGDIISVEDNQSKTGEQEADTSSTSFEIEKGQVSKYIYAINGSTTLPDPLVVRPGDTVTYRLKFSMPTPDVEDLVLHDYLPLPVFDATEISNFDNTSSQDVPPAGTAKYGPDDTFHDVYDDGSGNNYPALSSDGAGNRLDFTYGDFDSTDTDPRTIDILFTVTVKDDPFADELYLANMVRAHNGSTNSEAVSSDGIVQIKLVEPNLKITKGVSQTNNPNAVISPPPSQKPIDGDVENCDANDTVTFVITVKNQGHAPAYDVTITDDTDQDMDDCTVVSVKNGQGDDLNYSGDLFNNPMVLNDPLYENGSRSGNDTALVTFTCRIHEDAKPTDFIDREAGVQWAAGSGADKYPEKTDNATVSMALPDMSKAVSDVDPGPISLNMTIGDTVTYRIDVTLPEGNIPSLVLTDTLPAGLQYVTNSLDVNTTDFEGSFETDPPSVSVSGQELTIDFGNATVTSDNQVDNNSFYLTFQAKVLDVAANSATTRLQRKYNRVELTFSGYSGSPIRGTATNYLGEPFLDVTKTITPSKADAGDQITIDINVENTGTSPAFDIKVSDDLDGNVFDLNNVSEGTTPANFDYSYSSPTVTYTSHAGYSLAPGSSVSFSFLTYVIQDIVTSTPYENTAKVIYSSQSGNVDGERGGSEEDNATIEIATVLADKDLVTTSEPSTSGTANPVAVGETATFEITFTMPEGKTKGIRLFDMLSNVSGTPWGEYVSGTAQIKKNSDELSCTGQICTDALNGANPDVWVNADSYVVIEDTNSYRRIVLDLGNATNTNNDNNSPETYILRLTVVVLNNQITNAGTTLRDRGGLYYTDSAGTEYDLVSDPINLLVAEPQPVISKSASPTTAEAGDEITFTLNICNQASGDSAAAAFDWSFSDSLSDGYGNISSAVADPGTTGATVNLSTSGRTLTGTIDQLDPGECVNVTYKAPLSGTVQYSEQITNTVSFTTTSLPGTKGTGNSTPGDPGDTNGERIGTGGVNDLSGSSSATVTVSQPSLGKDIVDLQNWYAIGQNVTFEITAGVPKGTSKDFVITDQLPSGLVFQTGSLSVSLPQGSSSTNSPLTDSNGAFFGYDAASGNITMDFGNVTISSAGDIVIKYKAQVQNIVTNQDGTVLSNRVRLSYQDPENPNETLGVGPVNNQHQVHVGEPNLEMSKTITSGATDVDAGDTVGWQVTIQNTGHTTAYQVNWSDVLPDGLYHISNAHLSVSGTVYKNGTTVPLTDNDLSLTTTVNQNDTISLPALEIGPGASITISFDSVLMDSVSPGQVLNNQTRASYTSLVDGGRDNSSSPGHVDDDDDGSLNNYEESAAQSLTVASAVAIDKQVDKSRVTIGETVTFRIRASIIEGTTNSLVIHDILPSGFAYVSHQVHVGNSGMSFSNPDYANNIGSGQEVAVDLGNVLNPANSRTDDDYVELEIVAKAKNLVSNQNGTVLRNGQSDQGSDVYLTYGDSSGGTSRIDFDHDPNQPGNQGIPVQIVEPQLQVTKTVSPENQSLGDIVTFTVTVAHTGQSTSDAFDVVLSDQLPVGLTYVDSSLPVSDVSVNGQNLEFKINSITLSQGQTSFTYRARVDLDAMVGEPLSNSLHLTWKSLSGSTGSTGSGRTGQDCPPGLNDYCDDASASVTPTANAAVDAKKTVALVDDADGSGDVTSGDILEYTVLITNGNMAVSGAVFSDAIPENTTYEPGSITLDSVPMTDASDADRADFGQTQANAVTVKIGNMSAGSSTTVTFRVRINDYTPAGVIISNQGVVDTDQSVPEPTDSDGIDDNGDQPTDIPVGGGSVPRLRAEKTVTLSSDTVAPTDGTINIGDEITYTIRLINLGSAALHNVTFTDSIPASVTITGVNNANWTAPSSTVTAQFPVLEAGASQVITITGTVAHEGETANQGIAGSDEVPRVLTDSDPDLSNGEQPTTFVAVVQGGAGTPALDLLKRVELIGDTNGDGLLNPGETFRYNMILSNTGSALARGVSVDDQIPDHVTLVAGSVRTSKGAVVSDSPVSINIGDLAVGESVNIHFDVRVNSDVPLGTILSNQAIATDNSGNSVVSDDPSINDGVDCVLSALNCNDGDGGNDDPADILISGARIFDPPSAYKSGTLGKDNIITWRQVWINNGNAQAVGVRIIDPIPEHSTFVQGSLVCTPSGSSSTTACQYDAVNNRIIWQGSIGADLGATNEDDAQNEVVIEFQTLVEDQVSFISNQTVGYWDRDGDGFIDDDISSGQVAITSEAQVPLRVAIPTLSQWGMLLLVFLISLSVTVLRGRFQQTG